jgi:hypothetical protein
MSVHIVLPDERHQQLLALARALKVTVAEAVGVLVNDAIRHGKIPDAVPGFKIQRRENVISFEASGAFVREFNREAATAYAARIKAMAGPRTTRRSTNQFLPAVDIVRRGSGLKLLDPQTGAEKTLAPSVALDIARLIEAAASEETL